MPITSKPGALPLVMALDPGYGNTKVCVDGQIGMLQSAVSRPRDVGLAGIGLRTAGRNVPVIGFDGQRFAVGPYAWAKGDPLTSMDYGAITSPERTALFYGAVAVALPKVIEHARAQDGEALVEAVLVVGLPVPLLQDTAEAQSVLESLKGYKRTHVFTVNGDETTFTVTGLKVLAQPVGAYLDWLYDEQLAPRPGAGKTEVAVIDIGMNTLDLFVVQSGQVMERHVGGAEVGVRRLLEILTSNGHDLVETDALLRGGALSVSGAQLETWLGEILAAVKRIWPKLARFTAVIPTGGGAIVLGERLKWALTTKGAALHWPADPVTSNVRGLWKYGAKKHG